MEREFFYTDLNEEGQKKYKELFNVTEEEIDIEEPFALVEHDQWDDFESKYKPIQNPNGSDLLNGCLFDDTNEDNELLQKYPENKMWYIYDDDEDNVWILAGYYKKARGHIVTEVPWDDKSKDYCDWERETDLKIEDIEGNISAEQEEIDALKKQLEEIKKNDPVSLLTTGQELLLKIRRNESTIRCYEEELIPLNKKYNRECKRFHKEREKREKIIKEYKESLKEKEAA
jgi:hypothetical protein